MSAGATHTKESTWAISADLPTRSTRCGRQDGTVSAKQNRRRWPAAAVLNGKERRNQATSQNVLAEGVQLPTPAATRFFITRQT